MRAAGAGRRLGLHRAGQGEAIHFQWTPFFCGPLFGKFQRHAQRVHELVDLDGLGEIPEESCLQALPDVARHGIRAEGHDGDVRGDRVFAQDFHCLDTADVRQIDVHQDHLRLGGARKLDAESPVHRGQQAQIGAARDEFLNQLQVGRVVLYTEQGAQPRAVRHVRWGMCGSFASFNGKLRCSSRDQFDPEHASRPDGAVHADCAPHQFDQALGHHEADARAFLAPGLLSETIERLEQLRQLFRT